MVRETLTWSWGMPSNSSSMSDTVSMATPSLPTSPSANSWSESYPVRVGWSKSVLMPVCPRSSRKRYRWLVALAVPKPAIWRRVHNRPRYMVGYGPRVKG